MKPVSKKRQQRDRNYNTQRQAAFDRADGYCQAVCTWECETWGTQIHHLAGRGGTNPHRLENLLLVCAPCHTHIHGNPEESYANGWMIRRTGN